MEVSNCRLPLTILVRQPHRLKKAGGVCGRSAARFFVARIDGSCASVRLDATRQSSVMWWRTRCCARRRMACTAGARNGAAVLTTRAHRAEANMAPRIAVKASALPHRGAWPYTNIVANGGAGCRH